MAGDVMLGKVGGRCDGRGGRRLADRAGRCRLGDLYHHLEAGEMDITEAIHARRSVKEFTDRRITREEIERLLEAAVQAPNHRMTQPWRFYVLGPESRRGYGRALGARKARRVEDEEAAREVLRKVEEKHASLPAMLAVSVVLDDNPEIREEDYAATYMAIENLSLAAHAAGLGTHLKTGAVMDDPSSRDAVGVPEGERIVAIIELGEPASTPDARPRRAASELTTWVP
ncbi:MAG TPA: nitroreductase [Longimicrobiales bacterium]|nr:nitroreductase [Longimicrobiales bacterium]